MADYSIWILEKGNISVSNGLDLDGVTQGDGTHLEGQTITLNNNNWLQVDITDNGSDSSFDDNDGNQRLDGAQTIDGTTYSSGTRVEAEYRLEVFDSQGNSYDVIAFNVRNSSPAYGTIEGLAFVGPPQSWPPVGETLLVGEAFEGPGSSGQTAIPSDDYVVPCFTRGTKIKTPDGNILVEEIEVGQQIITLDRKVQTVRWAGEVTLTADALKRRPEFAPILLKKGALGQNQPNRDMMLSPQHRVLAKGWRAELLFGASEVLIAACHLVNDHDVRRVSDIECVTYYHFMFDNHEVVFANGLPTESFLPGAMTLGALSDGAREELLELFPELHASGASDMTPARPFLKAWEVTLLGALAA